MTKLFNSKVLVAAMLSLSSAAFADSAAVMQAVQLTTQESNVVKLIQSNPSAAWQMMVKPGSSFSASLTAAGISSATDLKNKLRSKDEAAINFVKQNAPALLKSLSTSETVASTVNSQGSMLKSGHENSVEAISDLNIARGVGFFLDGDVATFMAGVKDGSIDRSLMGVDLKNCPDDGSYTKGSPASQAVGEGFRALMRNGGTRQAQARRFDNALDQAQQDLLGQKDLSADARFAKRFEAVYGGEEQTSCRLARITKADLN